MNKNYRSIWNEALGAWVAVSEIETAKGKPAGSSVKAAGGIAARAKLVLRVIPLMLGMAFGLGGYAYASPGATITAAGDNVDASNAPVIISSNSITTGDVTAGSATLVQGKISDSLYYNENPGNPLRDGGGSGNSLVPRSWFAGGVVIGNNATAGNFGSIALGGRTSALGYYGIALGAYSKADNYGGIAIGAGSLAAGRNSMAMQRQAASAGDQSIAMGVVSYAKGHGSVAIGQSATAEGNMAVAIGSADIAGWPGNDTYRDEDAPANTNPGTLTRAAGLKSVALGQGAKATAESAFAAGSSAAASGVSAIAIGKGAQATGAQSISIGVGNVVSGANSAAIGDPSYVSGSETYVLGNNNGTAASQINASHSSIVGNSNTVNITGNNANNVPLADTGNVHIQGNSNTVSRIHSVVMGSSNTANGTGIQSAVAIGRANTVSGDDAIVIGSNSQATGNSSVVLGKAALANQTDGIAIGNTSKATGGQNATALGSYTTAGEWATSIGTRSYAVANQSTAFGTVAYAKAQRALSLGTYSYAGSTASTALGYESIVTDSAYSSTAIGAGSVVSGQYSGVWNASPNKNPTVLTSDDRSFVGGNNSYAIGNKNVIGSSSSDTFILGNNVKLGATAATLNSTNPGGTGNNIATRQESVSYAGTSNITGMVALGSDTSVTVSDGVALGRGSKAVTGSGVVGADPLSAVADKSGEAWTSTKGAVAVGDAAGKQTRQITGLAAGTADTDAVNVAQLKAAGFNLATSASSGEQADNTAATADKKVQNGETVTVDAGKNIKLIQDENKITVATKENLEVTSVNAGGNILNGDQMNVGGQAYTNVAEAINALDSKIGGSAAHYYSVNDGGARVGNYDNDGATGVNAMAAGVAAQAVALNATAVGHLANAAADNATALGNEAMAMAKDTVAVGQSADATADSAVAVGKNAQGAGNFAVSIGLDSKATNDGAVAMGSGSAAEHTYTVAIGNDAKALQDGATALGRLAQAEAAKSLALGTESRVTTVGVGGVAAGENALVDSNKGIAIGSGAKAVGQQSSNIAIGESANTDASGAIVIGTRATTTDNQSNTSAIVIGADATAKSKDAVGIGYQSVVEGASSVALGSRTQTAKAQAVAVGYSASAGGYQSVALGASANTADNAGSSVAIGRGASATVANGVALGAGSIADEVFGQVGTDPLNAAADKANSTWKATTAAVSVGKGTEITRQITSVAAGTDDTDAVNVAQLKAAGFNLATSASDGQLVDNTDVAADKKVQNGETVTVDAGKNIKITQNANTISVATKDEVNFTTVTAQDAQGNKTVLGANGVTITPNGSQTPVSLTSSGLNNGGNVISNVANGSVAQGSTEVVTGDQLYDIQQRLSNSVGSVNQGLNFTGNSGNFNRKMGENTTIKGSLANNVAASSSNIRTVADSSGNIEIMLADAPTFTGKLTAQGLDAGGQKITNVQKGSDNADAVNVEQLQDAIKNVAVATQNVINANSPFSYVNSQGEMLHRSVNPDGSVTFTKSADNTPYTGTDISIAALNAQDPQSAIPTTLGNIKAGTQANDAVNFSQLQNTVAALGGGAAINSDGTIKDPVYSITGTTGAVATVSSVGDALTALNTEVTKALTFSGDNSIVKVGRKLGEELAVKGGAAGNLTDGNIGVTGSTADNSLLIKLAEQINLGAAGSLQTGGTTVNNNGVTVQASGKQAVSLTSDGLNNGGNAITNVAAGKSPADAVNVSQLTPIAQALGVSVNSADGTVAAPSLVVTKADGSKYDGSTTIQGALDNIGTEIQKPINFAGNSGSLAKKLSETFTIKGGLADGASASSGNIRTKVDNGEMVIELAESPKFGGVTINDNGKITGIAAGDVAQNSQEAVNGGQLYGTANSVANALGGGSTVNADGTVSAPAYTIIDPATGNSSVANNVGDALTKLNGAVNSPLTFAGDSGNNVERKLGTTVNLKGGATGDLTDNNIAVVANGTDTLSIKLAETVNLGSNGSVTTGQTVLNNDGVKVGDSVALTSDGLKAGDVNITSAGIDAGDKQISGVKAGEQDTDAVNVAQLKAAAAASANKVAAGDNIEVAEEQNADGSTTYTVATAKDLVVDSVKAGNTTVNNEGVKVGDSVSLSSDGLKAGDLTVGTNGKISGLENGSIAAGSKEAVNGGQLYGTANSVANALGGGSVVNADGTVSAPAYTIIDPATGNSTVAGNVGDALTQLNSAVNSPLTFAGDSGSNVERKLGTTVNLKGGATGNLTDNNIAVVANGTNTLSIKLAETVNLGSNGSVTTGQTVLNNDGVKVGDSVALTSDGLKAGDVNITSAGIDAGDKKISGVKAGEQDTDAVNVAQLKAAAAASANKVAAGSNIEVAETKNADGSTTYTVATAKEVSFNSVTAGTGANRVVLDDAGVSVGGNTYISGNGINANNQKVTNVASGNVAAGSTDAVNGGQLHNTAASVANVFGGNATVNPDGSVSMSNIGGTGANNVNDAIAAVNQAAVEAKTTVSAGDNIVVAQSTNADGSTNYTVSTAKDLAVDSVKAGDTVLNGNGLSIANGPSITAGGLDMGGKKITNVADGEISATSKDAINGSQLYQAYQVLGGNANAINTITAPATENADGTTTPAGTVVTVVTNPDGTKTTTTETNQTVAVSTDKGGNQYTLTTYNVEGQNTYVTNDVIQAVGKMNEQGIKFFHTNDGVVEPVAQGHNTEDSSASGAYATAIGYQSVASGEGAVAMGNTYTASTQVDGAQVTEVKDAGGNVTGYAQSTVASGIRAIALGTGSQALAEDSIAIGTGNVVTGKQSGAIGDPTVVTGDSAYSIGNNNTVSADNAYALGSNIKATLANSVYLGDNASATAVHTTAGGGNYTFAGANDANVAGVQDAVGVVSVGTEGETRQIQNVAAGVVSATSTDAINGSQLHYTNEAINSVANYTVNMGNQLNQRIDDVENRSNAGAATAMAVAGLPQAYMPGKSMVAVAGGVYRGESGYAVGYSSISDNGNWVIKGSATGNSRGHYGATAGVGYQW